MDSQRERDGNLIAGIAGNAAALERFAYKLADRCEAARLECKALRARLDAGIAAVESQADQPGGNEYACSCALRGCDDPCEGSCGCQGCERSAVDFQAR